MIGMLWFDNDPKTDQFTKVHKAMDFYQQKYGQRPNLCIVNPCMVQNEGWYDDIRIATHQWVMPDNFYLVVNSEGQ